MKFWIKLFISSIDLFDVLTILQTYIIGANVKLLSAVMFSLSDNYCCFHIFSMTFSVKIIFKVGDIIIRYHNTQVFHDKLCGKWSQLINKPIYFACVYLY